MRKSSLKALFPLLMVLALLLVACGSPEATTAPPTSAATARPTAAQSGITPGATSPATQAATATTAPRPTQAPAATATAAPVSAGEIKVLLPDLSNPQLNPAGNAQVGFNVPYNELNYDFIMSATPEGPFDGKSGFIVSFTANPTSSVWTFKVRTDVVFTNGDTASATDLKYAIDLALDPKAPYNTAGEVKASVAKVEAPDAATAVVTLKATDIFWYKTTLSRNKPSTNMSYFLVPQKYLTTNGQEVANKNPIGSGPYKLKSATVGERIVMEAVEKHWLYGVPKTKTVTFLAIPDRNTQLALLKSKDGDAALVAPSDVASLKQAGLRIVLRENAFFGFQWSSQYPDVIPGYGPNPLVNKKVRQALFWYGVDRKALVDSFLNGLGTPSMDYPLPPTDAAYVKQPVPAYDPARAKALLAEAGYPKGFEIDYWFAQAPSIYPIAEINEAIVTWWTGLGIKVNRVPYTGTALFNLWLKNYKTGEYARPTVASLGVGGNALAEVNTSISVLQHNPESVAHIDRDPEGLRLALAFANAKTVEEYRTTGIASQAYDHEQVSTWMPYYLAPKVWAVSDKVTPRWGLGNDPGFRVSDMVALR